MIPRRVLPARAARCLVIRSGTDLSIRLTLLYVRLAEYGRGKAAVAQGGFDLDDDAALTATATPSKSAHPAGWVEAP